MVLNVLIAMHDEYIGRMKLFRMYVLASYLLVHQTPGLGYGPMLSLIVCTQLTQ